MAFMLINCRDHGRKGGVLNMLNGILMYCLLMFFHDMPSKLVLDALEKDALTFVYVLHGWPVGAIQSTIAGASCSFTPNHIAHRPTGTSRTQCLGLCTCVPTPLQLEPGRRVRYEAGGIKI